MTGTKQKLTVYMPYDSQKKPQNKKNKTLILQDHYHINKN
jgi:hypothetical protein